MKKLLPSYSELMLVLTLVFLFLPLFVVIFYSFNSGSSMVWEGFSLCWYGELFTSSSSDSLWRSVWNSVLIAATSSLGATVLGTFSAIGIKWYLFKGRRYIETISYLPMVLPEVIIGISMLIFFAAINLPLGRLTIFIAHTTFNLPYAYMLVSARLDDFEYSTVEAARDLGATEPVALMKVVFPSISPAIASSLLMCATLSLEDFVITFFVSGPGSSTLPLYVYSSIRYGVSPVINALSFVMILATMTIAFIFRRFLKTIAGSR